MTSLTEEVVEFTDEAHKAATEISYPTFGHSVLTVNDFLAAVRQPETVSK
jgi:hypothetical protein